MILQSLRTGRTLLSQFERGRGVRSGSPCPDAIAWALGYIVGMLGWPKPAPREWGINGNSFEDNQIIESGPWTGGLTVPRDQGRS